MADDECLHERNERTAIGGVQLGLLGGDRKVGGNVVPAALFGIDAELLAGNLLARIVEVKASAERGKICGRELVLERQDVDRGYELTDGGALVLGDERIVVAGARSDAPDDGELPDNARIGAGHRKSKAVERERRVGLFGDDAQLADLAEAGDLSDLAAAVEILLNAQGDEGGRGGKSPVAYAFDGGGAKERAAALRKLKGIVAVEVHAIAVELHTGGEFNQVGVPRIVRGGDRLGVLRELRGCVEFEGQLVVGVLVVFIGTGAAPDRFEREIALRGFGLGKIAQCGSSFSVRACEPPLC